MDIFGYVRIVEYDIIDKLFSSLLLLLVLLELDLSEAKEL